MLVSIARAVHIGAGALALVSGLVPLVTRKGSAVHRRSGVVYIAAMSLVLLTAVVLSLVQSIPFLLMVAVFSWYLLISGYRSSRTRHVQRMPLFDRMLAGAACVGGAALIGYGGALLLSGHGFGVVPLVFGGIGGALAVGDLRSAGGKERQRTQWVFVHIARMTGAYISTVTAFLVVNLGSVPLVVRWLVPTVIGTAVIVRWNRVYRRKTPFVQGRPESAKPAAALKS